MLGQRKYVYRISMSSNETDEYSFLDRTYDLTSLPRVCWRQKFDNRIKDAEAHSYLSAISYPLVCRSAVTNFYDMPTSSLCLFAFWFVTSVWTAFDDKEQKAKL